MLSIFKEDDVSFAVCILDQGNALDVLVSDGLRAWRTLSPVSAIDKPANRKHESDDEFLAQFRTALRKDDVDNQSLFEVDLRPGEDGLRLTVKENIRTTSTKTILYKSILSSIPNAQEGIMTLFMSASAKARQDLLSASAQEKTLIDYEKVIDTLKKDTKSMTVIKDKLQDELITKTCIVINSKKREIERLNKRVTELEEAMQCKEAAGFVPSAQSAETSKPRAVISTTAAKKTAQRRTAVKKPVAQTGRRRRRQQPETSSSEEEKEDQEDNTSDSSSPTTESLSTSREETRHCSGRSRFDTVPTVTQSLSSTTAADISANPTGASLEMTDSIGGFPLSAVKGAGIDTAHDSDSDDLFISKHRKTQIASPSAAPVPVPASLLTASIANPSVTLGNVVSQVGSQVTKAVPLSQSSTADVAQGGRLSKFLAEDSDEEANCLNFI